MIKIPLSNPCITSKDIKEVQKVLQTGMLVQGRFVEKLEKEFNQLTRENFSVAVSNGTASLHLALVALGIGKGDEVIVPAFSYIATANVVELVGAKPIFVDIDIPSFNIDVKLIEDKITKKTKAIIPVHEFGLPCEMDQILRISKKYDLFIIEDAACAIGSFYKDKHVGTFGDFGSFSLHPRKTITSGEGGVIIAKSLINYQKLRMLRNHGMSIENQKPEFKIAGFNYRLTDIQASLAFSQIKRLNKILSKRKKIVEAYKKFLNPDNIIFPLETKNLKHSWQTFHIVLEESINRDLIIQKLFEKGIQTNIGAQCIPLQKFYLEKYNLNYKEEFPNSYKAYSKGLAMPLFEKLKISDVKYVSKELNKLIL